jgi:hypothetical protein
VPVYGWAKFSAISALISRLVFAELVDQPESESTARTHVNSRMWDFFVAGILVSLIIGGAFFGSYLALIILGLLAAVIVSAVGQQTPVVLTLVGLLAIAGLIALIIGIIRLYSRLAIAEVPLAIENNVTATSTISRSWDLTKGSVGRLQLIVFVAFLISLPLQIVVYVITNALPLAFPKLIEQSPIFSIIFFVLVITLNFASGAAIMPFWQAIKAVIYYDLRSRREGLGLKLRDRNDMV